MNPEFPMRQVKTLETEPVTTSIRYTDAPLDELKKILRVELALSMGVTKDGQIIVTGKDHDFLENNLDIAYPYLQREGAIVYDKGRVKVEFYNVLSNKPFGGTEAERIELENKARAALLEAFGETL